MNILTKLTIATGISFGTIFGIVDFPGQESHEVEAATTP